LTELIEGVPDGILGLQAVLDGEFEDAKVWVAGPATDRGVGEHRREGDEDE